MSETTTGHTTNIFLGGNVMSEAELSRLAMGQATSNAVTDGDTTTTAVGEGTVVHVIRHGKRGSHCLQMDPGSTINDVMSTLMQQTGDSAWNSANNTFSVRVDGGELSNDCDSSYEFSGDTETTLIVSPKVIGG